MYVPSTWPKKNMAVIEAGALDVAFSRGITKLLAKLRTLATIWRLSRQMP